VVAGCVQPVGPARTFGAYQDKAKDTAETVLSSIETDRLAVQVAGDGNAFPPYLSVLTSNAEEDASNAQSTFESIQPPDERADRLRARLGRLLTRATNALAEVRIAARRADFGELARFGEQLERLARQVERFEQANDR
jgi:hypothetical protein